VLALKVGSSVTVVVTVDGAALYAFLKLVELPRLAAYLVDKQPRRNHPPSQTSIGINVAHGIAVGVRVRVDPAVKPDGIGLGVDPTRGEFTIPRGRPWARFHEGGRVEEDGLRQQLRDRIGAILARWRARGKRSSLGAAGFSRRRERRRR
jgi:hypothetical protein